MLANLSSTQWSEHEINTALTNDYAGYLATKNPETGENYSRSRGSFNLKRSRVLANPKERTATIRTTKIPSEFNWRDAARIMEEMQALGKKASHSQDTATIVVDTDRPIAVLALSDTHIGDWATDYRLFRRITDEILSIPDLYVALLGDLANMAIKLRSVSEVKSDMLPPELQAMFIEQWLDDISHKVLFATWDNHAIEREESQSGTSMFKSILGKRVVYFGGIGHPDVKVGDQVYKFAVSHRFNGRSMYNPNHAPQRYLRNEAPDREIAMMGDYHVPGIQKFTIGGETKVSINAGSIQTNSGYAKRYFSLRTHDNMPLVVLNPKEHLVTPFWSVKEWLSVRGAV